MSTLSDHIVVGYDGSTNARDALALGGQLAQATGATLVVTFVMRDEMASVGGWEDYKTGARGAAEHEFRRAEAWLGDAVPLEFDAVPARSPAKGLAEAALAHHAGLVVVGSSHRGKAGVAMAGSVAERLLHGSHCTVAVAPVGLADAATEMKMILVGYDDTDESAAAIETATGIAQSAGAKLGLVSVLDPRVFADYSAYAAAGFESGTLKEGHRMHLEQSIEQRLAAMPQGVEAAGEVVEGNPVDKLSEAAQQADLLVLGSRGYGPVRSVLLGSVSSRLTREAPCAVMVTPRAGD